MRETKYSKPLYNAIRKLNLDKEELKELLLCLYINGCSSEDCAKLFGTSEEKVINFLELEVLYGYKACVKCGQLRDRENDFHQNKKQKKLICNVCKKGYDKKRHTNNKGYYENNKEKIKEYRKEYYENNKEKLKEEMREYHENNKTEIKEKRKEYNKKNKDRIKEYEDEYKNSEASVGYVQKLATFEEVSGNQIRCKYCGRWMTPTNIQIRTRLQGIEDNDKHYIYCSEECKEECPTYGQKKYPKGFKQASSRETNPVLRQLVLERDEYTCQKCGKYKNVRLHCHHITPVADSPMEADDPDTCITFCKDCHKIVHKIPGCTYQELRCA